MFFFILFPYFRGNSLNSRAGLEFNEFRPFSTIIVQKKGWNSTVKKNIVFSTMIFLKNIFFFSNRGKQSNFLKFKASPWI